MSLLGFFKKKRKVSAFSGYTNTMFAWSYNGEKNMGEIGPIKDYKIDYEALRLRSWQSYLESEISQTVLNKFAIWVIGAGLKLQADPAKNVLKSEQIILNSEEFNEAVEARFSVYAKSKSSDYAGMKNLDILAEEAFKNSIIGGDVLVIIRYEDKQVKVQLVDGSHIGAPSHSPFHVEAKERGNIIRNGIELSPKGEHIAYYVRVAMMKYERVPAKGSRFNNTMAFMVYGLKYRLDNHRGLPLISTVLETLKKLDRYKEATVGSAEERQKIAFSIEHDVHSTGENPLTRTLSRAFDADASDDNPKDINGTELANNVAATTNKQAINMPVGAKLNMLESKNELYFKDFYSTNIELVCAAIGIPPEVAMSKYDSNFSASRAALKDWEHTINVNRQRFAFQFYQPIYNFWLDIQVLNNKVQAPGYLKAFINKDVMVLDSYRNARFIGPSVPHIDPLKEVKAEREKLGELGKHIPLTTVEQATEVLNGGNSDSNMAQFAEEFKESIRLELKPIPAEVSSPIKEKNKDDDEG